MIKDLGFDAATTVGMPPLCEAYKAGLEKLADNADAEFHHLKCTCAKVKCRWCKAEVPQCSVEDHTYLCLEKPVRESSATRLPTPHHRTRSTLPECVRQQGTTPLKNELTDLRLRFCVCVFVWRLGDVHGVRDHSVVALAAAVALQPVQRVHDAVRALRPRVHPPGLRASSTSQGI